MSDPVRRVAIIAAIALAALTAGGAAPSYGASFTVNATHDAVDASPGDGICADAAGACTLRAAVDETNALPGADEIVVPPGTYGLTYITPENPYFTAGLSISDSLTISGAGAASTIVERPTGGPPFGGGLSIGYQAGPGSFTISDVTIRYMADLTYGGAIENDGYSVTLDRVALVENSAASEAGGGAYNSSGDMTIRNSLISGNSASRGGGLAMATGTMSVVNTTISGNTGVYDANSIYSVGGHASVRNSTVLGEMTGPAGGLSVLNTIFSGGACFESLGHNIGFDITECALTGPGDLIGVNPQLTGLQNNGGPTLTHGLYPSSPAIDAGDNAGCPAIDQRGVARPQGAACDVGAYEYVTPPTAPPTDPPADTPPPTDDSTDTPTLGPTPKPKPSVSPSPSPTPSPSTSATAASGRRQQPTFAAVLVDAPEDVVEEDGGGGVSAMAAGLAAAGMLGLTGSAATAGFFWHRRRRFRRR